MHRIRALIHEVHRRSLWQVLTIYLVGSWIGYEVIHGLTQGLGLPDWVPPFAVVLFIIGLPIVLATAFVQEGAPQGVLPGRGAAPASVPAPSPAADAAGPGEAAVPAAAAHGTDAPQPGPDRAAAAPSAVPAPDPWLTWRRSILAGITAFLLLGLTAGGYMGMRNAGIGPAGSLVGRGVVEADERILIADFAGADTSLANVITEAFRIDFARSKLVRAVEPAAVRDALRRMERTDAARLDEVLAYEMARRDGINVVLTGEVASAAGGHVLSVRLVATGTGEVLAAVRETARADEELLPAVDRLSRAVRERLGESLRSIRRTEPLAQVTTSSLAALEKYTQSQRATSFEGNTDRGLALLHEAVELDTAFGAAWYGLGIQYSNRYQPDRAMPALERALRHPERLTEAQRHQARSTRHSMRREYAQAAAELERYLPSDSTNFAVLNNLGLAYAAMGEYERAEQYYRRAIAADTGRFFARANLAENHGQRGNLDDALAAYADAALRAPEAGWPKVGAASVLAAFGRHDEAEAGLRALHDDASLPRSVRQWAARDLRRVLGARGRYAEGDRLTLEMAAASGGEADGTRHVASRHLWTALFVLGQPDRVRRALDDYIAALERDAPADTSEWLGVAVLCGWSGNARCARDALARGGQSGAPEPWASIEALYAWSAAALADGDYPSAIRHLRAVRDRSCRDCDESVVGRVFERMGQPDSALAAYERYLRITAKDRIYTDETELGPALLRAGLLHEGRGDTQAAAARYSRLLELWGGADPELRPIVDEVRARLARLRPDR